MFDQLWKIRRLIEPGDYWLLALYLMIVIGSTFLEAGGIGLVFGILSFASSPDASGGRLIGVLRGVLGGSDRHEFLVRLCIATLAIFVLRTLGMFAASWAQHKLRSRIHINLARRLVGNYMRAPYVWHLQQTSAQLYTDVTNTIAEISQSCILGVLDLLGSAILIIVFSVGAILLRPVEMSAVVSVMVLAIALYLLILRRRLTRWGAESAAANVASARAIAEPISGIKTVQAMGLGPMFCDQYIAIVRTHMAHLMRHNLAQLAPRLVLEIILVSGLLLGVALSSSTDSSAPAMLLVLGAAAYRIVPAAAKIIQSLQMLRYSRAPLDRIIEGLDLPAADKAPVQYGVGDFKALKLTNVTFSFPSKARPAVEDITLSIKRCELVGLVGLSGAGKSTLADIMLGLLTPQQGRMECLERPPRVSYVAQEPFLIEDSLLNNVTLGDDRIDLNLVRDAIGGAHLNKLIDHLPQGIDTQIGGRGIRLSGGERQRLGIARALYRRAELLVLDEPTSALDAFAEEQIARTLQSLRGHCAVVVIAHRVNMLRNFDTIVLLDDGHLVASGDFGTLYRSQPQFRVMVDYLSIQSPSDVPAKAVAT